MKRIEGRIKALEQAVNPELGPKMTMEILCKLIGPEGGGSDKPFTPQEEAWCEKYLYPLYKEDYEEGRKDNEHTQEQASTH